MALSRKTAIGTSGLAHLWGVLKGHPLYAFGLTVVLVYIVLIVVSPLVTPYSPTTADAGASLQPPSGQHWFGTDRVGLDIFSRVIAAPRIDLTIGIAANLISASIGAILGVITGYYRGWWSESLARTLDLIQTFPSFVLAMAAVAVSGASIQNIILVLGLFNIPIYARLVRSRVYSVREAKFIEAATCLGNTDMRIVLRHVLPNSIQPVYVQFSVLVGAVILLTAGLSFIGVGVRVPTPEWGSMISLGAPQMITGEWWVAFFPGAALALCVLGFAILGDAVDLILDPTRR